MPTILITGGHSGIGIECCKILASTYNYNLILAGRSPGPMENFAKELIKSYGVKVSVLAMDTSSLTSVRSGALYCREMIEKGEVDKLQAIICNAGVRLGGAPTYTVDGYEETLATNYLGHVLLLELLLDCMADNGRIVFTASGTHDPDTADGKMMGIADGHDAIGLANTGKDGAKPVSRGKLYATSKLYMILYAYELDRRLRKAGSLISSIAFDPGATSGTGFLRNMPKPVQWLAGSAFMSWVMKKSGVTIGDIKFSGECLARVTADPEYASGSGKYFQTNDGKLTERRSSKLSYDEQRAVKLWKDTKSLIHIQPNEGSVKLR
ncbi:SDR family NAD(P)-dependent oxidoreductase [Dyadobacter sp. NIV53]|uniref:SDR family NAD(P)-dependent oxidoreductase n=1 Tax=Dyadobacter sp. NIV53 TaxID=2861765 RepID=UPI001C879C3B|nr:SDR family NAD(P)-dependent oxidoreductase [Dyadobacter sp. NIV53]